MGRATISSRILNPVTTCFSKEAEKYDHLKYFVNLGLFYPISK